MYTEKYKLLLVEDDDIDIISFQRAIKKTGLNYELDICKNSTETFEFVTKKKCRLFFIA